MKKKQHMNTLLGRWKKTEKGRKLIQRIKKTKQRKKKGAEATSSQEFSASFMEDGDPIEMQVTDEQTKEFPSTSDEEAMNSESEDSEVETTGETTVNPVSQNNNATIMKQISGSSVKGSSGSNAATAAVKVTEMQLPNLSNPSPGETVQDEAIPSTSSGKTMAGDEQLKQTLSMVQSFMLQRGLIDKSMTEDEMQEFFDNSSGASTNQSVMARTPAKGKSQSSKTGNVTTQSANARLGCESELTIYKNAVPLQSKGINEQIEQFIEETRRKSKVIRKESSSSDEMMDISDESMNAILIDSNVIATGNAGVSTLAKEDDQALVKAAQGQAADELIKESERSRARLLDIPGRNEFNLNTIQMDEDYHMIDAHIDEVLRRKIWCFEYVDFSKLISKNKLYNEDQRLEIVSHNGATYLSPANDRDSVQINTYNKWEQASRVYSNVLTSRYADKATELLQYNHTIHTASMLYTWENVYLYDREFRRHISRHPTRSWGVILQQAWTMILKDRLRSGDNAFFQKGNFAAGKGNKKDREPCRRFNKGRCTFGLSCKFDHRCSVKK